MSGPASNNWDGEGYNCSLSDTYTATSQGDYRSLTENDFSCELTASSILISSGNVTWPQGYMQTSISKSYVASTGVLTVSVNFRMVPANGFMAFVEGFTTSATVKVYR